MMYKEVLGLIAALFAVASGTLYLTSIVRGKTKPHLYTHLLWTIVTGVLFAGQFVSGAGPGSWAALVSTISTILVVPLAFRFGTHDVTRSDLICLVLGVFTVVPWILFKDPLWSVILAVLIDGWAMIPTLRKTWNNHASESLLPWMLAEVKHAFAIPALSTYSVTTLLYPLAAFLVNATLIFVILFQRKRGSKIRNVAVEPFR